MRASLSLILVLVGCADPSVPADAGLPDQRVDLATPDAAICELPLLPRGGDTLSLGAAGAPLTLFGPESSPTFEQAFDTLHEIGFSSFFPWFGEQEIDGVASVTGHFDYFLPSAFVGPTRNCSVLSPYEAAAGRIGILFPAFFLSDAEPEEALDPVVFRDRYALFQRDCWREHEDVVMGHESFDEIVSQRLVADFSSVPGPRLANAPAAAMLLHELSDQPVFLIEAPLPLCHRKRTGHSGCSATHAHGNVLERS